MENLHTWLSEWSSRSWPWMLNHLWQSTLFVIALAPALLVLRRAPARLRYSASLLASFKFLLPSAAFFVLLARLVPEVGGWFSAENLSALHLTGLLGWFQPATGMGGVSGALHGELYCVLTVLWLTGAVGLALRWWSRHRSLLRALRTARPMTEGAETEALERVRTRLGLKRRVRLALLPGAVEPGVWGILRPVLVLPEEMPRHLSEGELEAIFLHELIHVRRWDNLVASLHMVLCCLFWFHPMIWLLDRRLLAEREEACDERVLELAGGPETYLRGLLKAVRFGIGWRLAGVSSAASTSNFRRRIERIRSGVTRPRSSLTERALLGGGVALLLAFSIAAGPAGPSLAARSQLPLRAEQAERPACSKKLQAESTGGAEAGVHPPSLTEVPVPPAPTAPTREKCKGQGNGRWASKAGRAAHPEAAPSAVPAAASPPTGTIAGTHAAPTR